MVDYICPQPPVTYLPAAQALICTASPAYPHENGGQTLSSSPEVDQAGVSILEQLQGGFRVQVACKAAAIADPGGESQDEEQPRGCCESAVVCGHLQHAQSRARASGSMHGI